MSDALLRQGLLSLIESRIFAEPGIEGVFTAEGGNRLSVGVFPTDSAGKRTGDTVFYEIILEPRTVAYKGRIA